MRALGNWEMMEEIEHELGRWESTKDKFIISCDDDGLTIIWCQRVLVPDLALYSICEYHWESDLTFLGFSFSTYKIGGCTRPLVF